ncbi:MAG: 1-deoxy-D-xylulose-5-phosphate reductoisomerase [Candidatus Omnitrophica bacterium]|nr:1-deoxy-D-xylulose-5-phosphate reductoisomerase [Candidatus Omnitrophota bacterium]
MMTRIAILGSTGSIGVNTLSVLSGMKDRFKVAALSADKNVELLSKQAAIFKPRIACVGTEMLSRKVSDAISRKTRIVSGVEGLKEIVSSPDVDLVVFAISGSACLIPLVEAIKKRKRIALANKESLVSAGVIIMKLAKKNNVRIIPVDSEHSAIFQCIDGKDRAVSKIYLTGSGGPLLNVDRRRFDRLTKNFILNHPKWKMGRKISVDSATMMNKGLEIIEAGSLFGLPQDRIEVLIHPEAIVHSMVEFSDSAILAQLGTPDMRLPIQYALTYPDRGPSPVERIDFSKIKNLSFDKPDAKKFPSLRLARQAARDGGVRPAVLCAADEEAVRNFLNGTIKFSGITKVIEKVLSRHDNINKREISLDDVLASQVWAREEARSICCH